MTSTSSCMAVVTICSGVCLQAGIDHFHPRIPQGVANHLDAPVVSVQAGFGRQYPYLFCCCHDRTSYRVETAVYSPNTSRRVSQISPRVA